MCTDIEAAVTMLKDEQVRNAEQIDICMVWLPSAYLVRSVDQLHHIATYYVLDWPK